jgi:Mg2+-importing ATPase
MNFPTAASLTPHPTRPTGDRAVEALPARLASMPIDDFLQALAASPDGLHQAEADARLLKYGRNETGRPRYVSLKSIATSLLNPLVLILLLSSLVSAFLGEAASAAIIVAMVLLSVTLDFVLSYRSQRAAERLREGVAPTATVCRDGAWRELPRRELVPGDLIRLAAGDRIPADARLLHARDLHVQQAALTGESVPAEKTHVDVPVGPTGPADASHIVFLGTSVVAGTATAIVFATGGAAAFGDIASQLAERPPQTGFERGLAGFSVLIMRTVVFLVLFVMLASLVLGRPGLESLLFAVALAVGLTPEFMPMITTVTLARGAIRMASRHVIVKHLAAIDNFGGMDILLSDKTGTLTTGEMTLDASIDAAGAASERPLELGYLNSTFETGIRSPLDAAVLTSRHIETGAWRKLDEIPFDFERRCLSVVVARGQQALLIAKGAPESLLRRCTSWEQAGQTRPLDAAAQERCTATFQALGERGMRVLAVAFRDVEVRSGYSVQDEAGLVFAGFLAFVDPPLAGVAETMQALARDGITVKILSGDNECVARHVCTQVGIDPGRIVLGEEVDALSDIGLAALAERSTIFARMSPAQKHRVVLALKGRGHVVGFLGDGINDAPSLHAADIGISVVNATDIAKDAADILLRERRLDVLHDGVIEGRRAFANVMKYLLMGTSSNFGNMFSMAAGVLFLPFLPMLPMQILLNNFLYDLAQVTIPTDRVDDAQLHGPQRWDIRLIRNFMLLIGPISSIYDFLTFFALLKFFHAGEAFFHTGWFVESLATQTLVLFVIRTFGNPLRSRPSAPLVATTLTVVAVALALPFTPWAAVLGFTALPAAFFAFLAAATATYLVIVEIAKRWLLRGTALHPSLMFAGAQGSER